MDNKNQINSSISLTNSQLYVLVALRVLIGWHILYEGIAKLVSPYWSSAGFLLDSKWIFSGLAKTIVSNPTLLTISDYGNMWALTIIGLLLMIGLFNRYASIAGMILILSYYLFSLIYSITRVRHGVKKKVILMLKFSLMCMILEGG